MKILAGIFRKGRFMAADNIHYIYNSNMGIELIYCGNSTISYPLHNHVSVLTVGIVLDGHVALTVNGEGKIYGKNQSFVIYPYMPHSILAHSCYTLLSICIDKNVASQAPAKVIWNCVVSLLKSELYSEGIPSCQILKLLTCLTIALEQCVPAICDGCQSGSSNPLIIDLKKQLESCPENKLSVGEMAQTAFVSKYHFIRSFKAEVGLTPHQFQLQNRIRKAQRLMHTAGTITEVALATGFCDQSHFIRQFEKQVGLTPLTYKMSSKMI